MLWFDCDVFAFFSELKLNTWLTHWGWVTQICVRKLTIIGSDNGLSPGRRQDIIWTNAGISLIGTLGTNLSEMFIEIHTFSFKKMHLKMSSGKLRPFCLSLNVLRCDIAFIYPMHCNKPNNIFFNRVGIWTGIDSFAVRGIIWFVDLSIKRQVCDCDSLYPEARHLGINETLVNITMSRGDVIAFRYDLVCPWGPVPCGTKANETVGMRTQ